MSNTDKTGTRRERRKERTRKRLLEAAEHLIQSKGFEKSTVEEIADAADVAKGTFFNYFANKQSLLNELLHKRIHGLLICPPGTGKTAPERITMLFTTMRNELKPYQSLTKMMLNHSLSEEGTYRCRNNTLGPAKIFAELVKEGQEQGTFRPEVDADTAGILLATYFFRICVLGHIKDETNNSSWEKHLTKGLDIIYHGLLS